MSFNRSTMAADNLLFTIPQMICMAQSVHHIQEIFETQKRPWDPEREPDHKPKDNAIRRMLSDIRERSDLPAVPDGCYFAPLEENICKVHVIIVGPEDSPYEGGFFHFLIRFPPDYPTNPPKVKLLTTDNGTVRFNPNLYKNGKVCISMLGTWPGPSWGPAQRLYTVLDAIRGVMNKEPYYNEPGMAHVAGESEMYNEIVYHETLRVAVCGMLEKPNSELPESLKDQIEKLFLAKYDFYMRRVQDKMRLDKQRMMVHRRLETGGYYSYRSIRQRLRAIHGKLPRPEPQ